MTPERFQRVKAVLDRRQPDLTVITDKVHKGRNHSAIARTCDAIGIPLIHAISPEINHRHHRGTGMGAEKWVRTRLWRDSGEAIQSLQARGMQVLAAHLNDAAVDYRKIDYTRPTALLLGAEGEGVSDETAALVDGCITIPMFGMVESFNVSVAASIILAEARNQREAAGMYDQPALPKEEYDRLMFEWLHPTLTKFCKARNLPYPALDEEGEVADRAALKYRPEYR